MDSTAITITPGIDLTPILSSDLAQTTKAKYARAIANFVEAGGNISDPRSLAEYARDLPVSGRAFLKSAVRLLTEGYAREAKAQATPENVDAIKAALYQIEAIQGAITVKAAKSVKAHTWLSLAQVKALMNTCGDDGPGTGLEGRRDWIILALLVGAGLRREELAGLRFVDLNEQPVGGKVRAVLEVQGKGAKSRVIPISPVLAARLQDWRETCGGGLVARSLGRKREIGNSLSAVGLFGITRKHGAAIGKPELAPHDLRRTYAQLGYEAGVPITQISKLLGHSSVATTQRYLNLEIDLETTVSDFIPLG